MRQHIRAELTNLSLKKPLSQRPRCSLVPVVSVAIDLTLADSELQVGAKHFIQVIACAARQESRNFLERVQAVRIR
jgi:hypothetical protein